MADVITRFKLETTQYDSKLRDASKGLAEYTRLASMAGNEFGKFTQKNVEAARSLGTLTPSANNAKDKVKELVNAFNDTAKAYNALTREQQQSDFGKAMKESLEQLIAKIKEAKIELYDLEKTAKNAGSNSSSGGGGLFSGLGNKMEGALAVFGGNMITKAVGAVANLGSEIVDTVKQGVELARQGEGIRLAFERLGRGDILQGLREATHGTVTDLELMKAAVKFDDFKLPVEELGTMLAFAQQKAKDTGQSIDYMVDSIVTGLGRKSLMILDNLGLSANEIKEKMKETGDMTKAVGAIIREQMAKAGDYVETAADRAAKANTDLQNKMEELGRKFAPVEEASTQLWTSMKIAILDVIGGPLTRLLNGLTEAGRMKNALNDMNGDPSSGQPTKVQQQLSTLRGSNFKWSEYAGQVGRYNKQIQDIDDKINRLIKQSESTNDDPNTGTFEKPYLSSQIKELQSQRGALSTMKSEYLKGARDIMMPSAPAKPEKQNNSPTTTTNNPKGGKTPQQQAEDKVAAALLDYQQTIDKANLGLKEGYTSELDVKRKQLSAQERLYDAYGDAYNMYHDPKYKEAQDKAAEEIVRLQGEVVASAEAQKKAQEAARELETAQKKLADAQLKLAEAQESGDLKQIYSAEKNVQNAQNGVNLAQANLDSLSKSITVEILPKWAESALNALPQEIKDKLSGKTDVPIPLTTANLDAFIANTKEQIASSDLGSGVVAKLQESLSDATAIGEIMKTALKNGIDTADFSTAGLMQKLLNHEDIDDATIQSYVDQLNALLKEKFDETEWPKVLIKFDVNSKEISTITNGLKNDSNKLASSWSAAAAAISAVGNAMSAIEDPTLKVMGTIAQAVASIALGASQAIAQASNGSAGGPWGWIAFAVAATATMISTIASVHNATGYAQGGIVDGRNGGFVGGMSYSGDNVGNVRLNSGELVLNRSQQNNLANALTGSPFSNLQLSTHLTAEDIEIVLNDRNSRTGYGEIMTSRDYY